MKTIKKILFVSMIVVIGMQGSVFAMFNASNLRKLLGSTCALASSVFMQNVAVADQSKVAEKDQIVRNHNRKMQFADQIKNLCLNNESCKKDYEKFISEFIQKRPGAQSIEEWKTPQSADIASIKEHQDLSSDTEVGIINEEWYPLVERLAAVVGLDYVPKVYEYSGQGYIGCAQAYALSRVIYVEPAFFYHKIEDIVFILLHEMTHLVNNDAQLETLDDFFSKEQQKYYDALCDLRNKVFEEMERSSNLKLDHVNTYIDDFEKVGSDIFRCLENAGTEDEAIQLKESFQALLANFQQLKSPDKLLSFNTEKGVVLNKVRLDLDRFDKLFQKIAGTSLESLKFAIERRADMGALSAFACPMCLKYFKDAHSTFDEDSSRRDKGYLYKELVEEYIQNLEKKGALHCCGRHCEEQCS